MPNKLQFRWVPAWQRRQLVHNTVRKLDMMLGAGIQLNESIRLISEGFKSRKYRQYYQILRNINSAIESGKFFYQTLSRYPKWFSPMMVALIRVGETSGKLNEVISKLLIYFNNQEKYRKKLTATLTYPIVVIIIAIITVIFIVVFLLPTFSSMYSDMGMELPTLTRFILAVSNYLGLISVLLLLLVILIFILIRKLEIKLKYKQKLIKFALHLPLFGRILKQSIVGFYLQILVTLLESGLTLLKSLEVCQEISKYPYNRNLWAYIIRNFKSGKPFYEIIGNTKILDLEYNHIIEISESTGELTFALSQIHKSINSELETKIESTSSILEPIIIVILGFIIGLILVAMYLPIFELSSTTL